MLQKAFDNVRKNKPLIHNITNYVTVHDCANIIIACGGSPIMADEIEEVSDITSICSGLNINIGTLNKNSIEAMFIAGKKANELNHPILLDPVGAGASKLRTETAIKLIKEIRFSVIRGNISEIKALSNGCKNTKGVDADINDIINQNNIETIINLAKNFSEKTGAIIAITGAIDIVANKNNVYIIKNGCPEMSHITGSGCMLSAMTTAFICANPSTKLHACAASVCAMGLAGEKALQKMKNLNAGNASYSNLIIDEIYNMNGNNFIKGAKYEYR